MMPCMMNIEENNVIPIASRSGLTQKSDDELMQLAAAGYRDAFSELMKRYQAQIRGFCQKWHSEKGDDLAQDVFVRLWNARKKYVPKNEFKAYLYMIAVNICRNAKRSESRKPPTEKFNPDVVSQNLEAGQLDNILHRERQKRVHNEISRLPPKLREAILLRYGQDLSYREIQKATGVRQETLRSRVLLAINKLKGALV